MNERTTQKSLNIDKNVDKLNKFIYCYKLKGKGNKTFIKTGPGLFFERLEVFYEVKHLLAGTEKNSVNEGLRCAF